MRGIKETFDFDDILVVPTIKTHVQSRYRDIELSKPLPLFTAPMDTVVDLENIGEFLNNGINITLPRTVNYKKFREQYDAKPKRRKSPWINKQNPYYQNTFFSVGFEELDEYYRDNFKIFLENSNILIDVANGHMKRIMDYAKEIKRLRPDITIMVGNIANPKTYTWYADSGCVDYIRVGIGNGNGCLTTKQSGIGHPMASLIHEIYNEKVRLSKLKRRRKGSNLPAIVADGGMKDYSDIIKSLALGADYVMVGSIFNKALESAAPNYLWGIRINKRLARYLFGKNMPIKKHFRGMSTKEAQKAMGKTTFKTSEGVVRFRKVEYYLSGWVENFEHYLRNAMSYNNAKTLEEFKGNNEICKISKNAYDRFNK